MSIIAKMVHNCHGGLLFAAPASKTEIKLSYSLAIGKVKAGLNHCSDYKNLFDGT